MLSLAVPLLISANIDTMLLVLVIELLLNGDIVIY